MVAASIATLEQPQPSSRPSQSTVIPKKSGRIYLK
jgi:hypothetical protein